MRCGLALVGSETSAYRSYRQVARTALIETYALLRESTFKG
jgi:hypothetical protein